MIDVLDPLSLAPPFSPGGDEEGFSCVSILDPLDVAPPFGCLEHDLGGDGDADECIRILDVLTLTPPTSCFAGTPLRTASFTLAITGGWTGYAGDVHPFAEDDLSAGEGHLLFFREVTMFQYALAYMSLILAALKGATLLKTGECEVHLFKNDIEPDGDTVVGDLEEADFDGYVAIDTFAFTDPVEVDEGGREILGTTVATFISDGATTPNTVYGFYIVDGTGRYVGAQRFETPQIIDAAGQAVAVAIRMRLAAEFSGMVVN